MAGKGGGAWKVAYADFVTAMMAFFMVMWLTSQNQKVKDAIARYFVDPVGVALQGSSMTPSASGSMFAEEFAGSVPGGSNRKSGRGLGSLPAPEDQESETMVVAEWVLQDTHLSERWITQAKDELLKAKRELPVKSSRAEIEERAIASLSKKMRQEITTTMLSETKGMSQDILAAALTKVQWNAIAGECLAESNNRK
ncbi:MAG: hypothetical protein JNL58_19350 [Planctomyces sp.]|nr:hypothetical protein [Planctomyces sp.]